MKLRNSDFNNVSQEGKHKQLSSQGVEVKSDKQSPTAAAVDF